MPIFSDDDSPVDSPITNPFTMPTIDHCPALYYAFDQSILSDREEARKEYAGNTSKNSGVSDDDDDFNVDLDICDDDDNKNKTKKRKNYYRYNPVEIYLMEDLLKQTPDPDDKKTKALSKQLGLHSKQVKFWIKEHRFDIKAMEEEDNKQFWLKSEMDKLLEDDNLFRETFKKGTCPNYGFSSSSKDAATYTNEQHLQIAKLRTSIGKYPQGTSPMLWFSSCTH